MGSAFGKSVSLSPDGSRLAVGATGANGSEGSVSVYRFEHASHAFVLEQTIQAATTPHDLPPPHSRPVCSSIANYTETPQPVLNGRFGHQVELAGASGDVLLVTEPGRVVDDVLQHARSNVARSTQLSPEPVPVPYSGIAYLYERAPASAHASVPGLLRLRQRLLLPDTPLAPALLKPTPSARLCCPNIREAQCGAIPELQTEPVFDLVPQPDNTRVRIYVTILDSITQQPVQCTRLGVLVDAVVSVEDAESTGSEKVYVTVVFDPCRLQWTGEATYNTTDFATDQTLTDDAANGRLVSVGATRSVLLPPLGGGRVEVFRVRFRTLGVGHSPVVLEPVTDGVSVWTSGPASQPVPSDQVYLRCARLCLEDLSVPDWMCGQQECGSALPGVFPLRPRSVFATGAASLARIAGNKVVLGSPTLFPEYAGAPQPGDELFVYARGQQWRSHA